MPDVTIDLLKANFRQLRLPTMSQEFEKLAQRRRRDRSELLSVPAPSDRARVGGPCCQHNRDADQERWLPGPEGFRHVRLRALPQLSKPKVLELARCEWIEHNYNCCLLGTQGTGKTHIAIALGLAACRQGLHVYFFTAADLIDQLEKAQKQYTLDKFLGQLGRAQLLICDELGYVSYSRGGVELLFRVFGDRYERQHVGHQ